MSTGKLSFANTKYISEEEHKLLSQRCHPCKGDLLLSKVGTTGIPLIIDDDREFSIFVSLALIKFPPEFIDSSFLIALLNSPLVQMQVKENTRGVGNKNWVLTAISNTLLTIPPLYEQKRIVNKLSILSPYTKRYTHSESKISHLNKEISSNLKKSILQEAIQGKLVPQDATEEPASILLQRIKEEKQRLVKEGKLKKKDVIGSSIFRGDDNRYYEQVGEETKEITEDLPFEIPVSWEWCRLRDICSIFTGASFKKDEVKTDNEGVRILRGGNIIPFKIVQKADDIFLSPEQVKESILLKQNDIITPAVTSLENIGKMARVENDMPNVTIGGFVFVLRPYYSDEWLSKFLLFFMSSSSAIEFMKSITNKSGQAFYNIGKERLATTLVPIPPKVEGQRIVVKIEEVFDRIKGD